MSHTINILEVEDVVEVMISAMVSMQLCHMEKCFLTAFTSGLAEGTPSCGV